MPRVITAAERAALHERYGAHKPFKRDHAADERRRAREAEIAAHWTEPHEALAEITAARRAEYRAHLQRMMLPDELHAWATRMAQRYGPKVKYLHNALPWLTAVLCARYGEAPEYWPSSFSADDVSMMFDMEHSPASMHRFMTLIYDRDAASGAWLVNAAESPAFLMLGIDEPSDALASWPAAPATEG